MDRLIAGVMIFALALLLPIGIAIAADWQPGQTHDLVTGLMTICGGAVALTALGVGLAVGIGLTRERDAARRANPTVTHTVEVAPQRDDLAYWRQQRAMIEAQRSAVALERDRRNLATPALPALQAQDENYGWTFTQQPAEMHDWVDAE